MPHHQLNLESLKVLDLGKVDEAFRASLVRVARDCMDRPGEAKARKVTLEVAVVPVLEENGQADSVAVQMQVTATVPKHRTRQYRMGLRTNGMIVFNEDDPSDFSRPTMFEDQE